MTAPDPSLWKPARDLTVARFENQSILMYELFHAALPVSAGIVRGRTFVNCRLVGPAVLLAGEGVQLRDCHLGDSQGDVRNLLFRSLSGGRMIGPIGFEDCTFEACVFFAVGYTGSELFLEDIAGSVGR